MKSQVLVRALLAGLAAAGVARGGERISFNDHWRFRKGDSTNHATPSLLYDIRPAGRGEDQKERLAEAVEDASALAAATNTVLKPWILPSGNAFIKDSGRHFPRPSGNPGGDLPYVQASFDDSSWRQLNLPHDWAIEGPFNSGGVGGSMGRLPSPGVGWYRKQFTIPASDADKRIFLDVDGAMAYAAVWLNGRLIGGWPYGYNSFRIDLTPQLNFGGTNQLAIRLDNPPDFSRWYPGAGIYRNVWLVKTAPVHVAQWGTYVTTPEVSRERARVNLKVTVDNDSAQPANVTLGTEIFSLGEDGKRSGKAVAAIAPCDLSLTAGARAECQGGALITGAKLWGPPPTQQPHRYLAVTTVSQGGNVLDVYETPFGVRKIECQPDGLFVNGERIRIRGVNQHHDLGALGAAFNERAAERQLERLRELGCNAIRLAHNPPAPELLELTDRLGFLVVDEVFDAWVRRKTPFDFHLIFPDWHEPDLRSMLRRDRNHPSVFLWSVGNEVGEQYTGEDGAKVAREMIALAHDEEPTRPAAASMNFAKPDSEFAAAMDVICLNYQGEGIRDTPEFDGFKGIRTGPLYGSFRDKFPARMIVSSESAAALSTRGTYLFPVAAGSSNPVREGKGGVGKQQYVSAYELYAADFGSSADKVFAAQDRHSFVAGEFVWSGWDYLGEPTPYYGARSSYFGIIDLAGFPKDRFYLYQSRWRPELPLAHILPHWTWPERTNQITPVHVFTSGDEAELFLNGKSLGRKRKGPFEYRLRWDDVVYQPGTLKVTACKNGKSWATDEVKTAGASARLAMTADRGSVCADGRDLIFVTVKVTDKHGEVVPRADARIHFAVEGPGEVLATDNGDPTCFDSFQSPDRRAFNGLCLAIIRSIPGPPGTIRIRAKAEGLKPAAISVRSFSIRQGGSR